VVVCMYEGTKGTSYHFQVNSMEVGTAQPTSFCKYRSHAYYFSPMRHVQTYYPSYFNQQPIADSVAQNLEIYSETLSTHQNFAHRIYD